MVWVSFPLRNCPIKSSNNKGFGLVGALVGMSVMSILGLSLMSLLSAHFKSNSAIRLSLDQEATRRSLMQRVDCDRSRPSSMEESLGKALVLRSKDGRVVFGEPSKRGDEGLIIGDYQYRSYLAQRAIDGLFYTEVESRLVDGKGRPKQHPLAQSRTDLEKESPFATKWRSLFSKETPLCAFSNGGGDGDDDDGSGTPPGENLQAELIYFPTSRFMAKDGDILVEASYVLDGAGSCQNTLVFSCNGRTLSREGQTTRFILKQDQKCEVRVESRPVAGQPGDCQSGLANDDNGLTAKQGFNQWRIQWEDRLARRADTEQCRLEKARGLPDARQSACLRLRAVDWNDAIWHIRGCFAAPGLTRCAPESIAKR